MPSTGELAKVCKKCGAQRSVVGHFYKYGCKRENRERSICKPCHVKQGTASRRRRWDEYKASVNASYYASPKKRAYGLWQRAKKRAEAKNLPFTITRDWVSTKLADGACEVTGVHFDLSKGIDSKNPLCPTLDRTNPCFGYTPENTRLVTWIYNRAKGDGTDADVMALAKAIIHAIN